jgi:hypothetical protein
MVELDIGAKVNKGEMKRQSIQADEDYGDRP